MTRKVAVEVRLVAGDELAGDDPLGTELVDPIDEQERVAMGEDPLDGPDVEHGASGPYFFGLGGVAAAAPPPSAPSPAL